jgi:general secretion pathway protein N
MDVPHILPAGVVFLALATSNSLSASPSVTALLESDSHEFHRPATGEPIAADAKDQGALDNPFRDIPLESLSATRERPLFSATRRPPPPAAGVAIQSAAPATQTQAPVSSDLEEPPLALIGTITGPEHPVAVLFNKLTRTVSATREGDEALGWRITAVSARSAIAEKDGVTVTLNLPRPGDPAASPMSPAPNP